MILFLNFAPISFMGGAEKWMNETAKKVAKKEPSTLVSVAGSIASIYSSIVLKRRFNSRAQAKDIHNHLSLDLLSFIPFTSNWYSAKEVFKTARLIYARYELPEFLILLYFSGFNGLRKTIAGLHSPFLYQSPESFFDRLHNLVYNSFISKKVLSSVKKVHVLNKRDYALFTKSYNFKNVQYVPNGMPTQSSSTTVKQDGKLHILYVGELSRRKGTDRLIEVIQDAPTNYIFTIAGDGPYKDEIVKLSKQQPNCIYKGFVSPKSLPELYKSNEVLFLPSRAESMSLSILEAMSYGLVIVDSKETSLHFGEEIEHSPISKDPIQFIHILNAIYDNKIQKNISPKSIKNFFEANFSTTLIDKLLSKNIFGII